MAVKRTTKSEKAPVIRKPSVRRKKVAAITRDEIATRAYYLHLEGGYDPVENWLQAERELAVAS
jgi:Protein of unknown function (DUF2934)